MAKSRLWITSDPVNDSAFISGWPARDLIEEVGGRPMWSNERRSWCVGQRTAEKVAALADYRGIQLSYTEEVAP